jgi:hypothetical protein
MNTPFNKSSHISHIRSTGSFNSSRGKMFTVENPVTCKRVDLHGLFCEQPIYIDDRLYKVIGIESFAIEHQHEGIVLGLLVEDVVDLNPAIALRSHSPLSRDEYQEVLRIEHEHGMN